jgi:hypothetical protein
VIRTFQETKGGLGEVTERFEMPEELSWYKKACPPPGAEWRHPQLPGILVGYRWNEKDHLIHFSRPDPDYRPEPLRPPEDSSTIDPVPTLERLMDWKIADLITKAAELNVAYQAGMSKAKLCPLLAAAWAKRNEELRKPPAAPPTPPK